MILKSQRNQLIDLLQKSSINLGQYDLKESPKSFEISIIDATANKYYFEIKPGNSFHFLINMRPGVETPTQVGYGDTWDIVKNYFATWARFVRREIDIPDVWADFQQTARLFAGVDNNNVSDDKFNRTELAEVQSQLRLLQLSFTQSALPEAAKRKLIELTQTAAVKAEGLTKKDWQNWIIGGFISAITSLALNPTQAGEVLKLVKAAFGGLFLH